MGYGVFIGSKTKDTARSISRLAGKILEGLRLLFLKRLKITRMGVFEGSNYPVATSLEKPKPWQ